ncbi:MAG: hydrogenase iron-sulfur subunit [Acidobacteriota bacterium]
MNSNMHQIHKTMLIWGEPIAAYDFVLKCSARQPVIWAHFGDVTHDIAEGIINIRAIGIDQISGSNGDFKVRIETDSDFREYSVGSIVVFPDHKADVGQKRLHDDHNENCVMLIDAAEVGHGQYKKVLTRALELSNRGQQIYFVTDEVQVAYPDGEQFYQKAREAGVVFFKDCIYRKEPIGSGWTVEISAKGLGEIDTYVIDVDEIIKVSPQIISSDYIDLLKKLGVGQSRLQEQFPYSTRRQGIFVVDDPDLMGSILTRTYSYTTGEINAPDGRFEIMPELCAMCLTCFRVCPHGALRFGQPSDNLYGQAMIIDDKACGACGMCYAECPAKAISLKGLGKVGKAVVLACENSGGPLLKGRGLDYRLFPCAGGISINDVLTVIEEGAERVLLLACHEGKCQHEYGGKRLQSRVSRLNRLLDRFKPGYKVELVRISAVDKPEDVLRRVGKSK